MNADVFSVIRDGKYACPLPECKRRFHTLAEKKQHVKTKHKGAKR